MGAAEHRVESPTVATAPKAQLRALPAVETLLRQAALREDARDLPRSLVVEALRAELAAARTALKRGGTPPHSADALLDRALAHARAESRPQLRRVLNATGVVLHTNLGRAPLSAAARHALDQVARGFNTLEYDLASGRRGERGLGVERWLRRLTGAESALVVNNGAAAVLLTLSAVAAGRPVIVSRGELVEIGGSFRIPEILERSGARLVEVGTTNRTHLRDYQRALERHRDTGAILRVHPSNFRIAGFAARPALEEIVALARRRRVPVIEDLGSGALVDLSELGLEREPTVRESLNAGCDVVTFSGDKLLGAPQAGLILGRKTLVERARRDPMARALRVDKLTLAALEATLPAYDEPARALREIPALAMLAQVDSALERRARVLAEAIRAVDGKLSVGVERGTGEVGGGALPLQRLPGWVVTLERKGHPVEDIDRTARAADPPVIGYIRAGKFRMDVRTIGDDEVAEVAQAFASTPASEPNQGGR
jgi:L-seryl-tRNA(Ser) seleniumtransferase